MPLNETTQVQYVQVAIHGKSAYIIKIPSSCYFKYTIEKISKYYQHWSGKKKKAGKSQAENVEQLAFSYLFILCKINIQTTISKFGSLIYLFFSGHETGRMTSLPKTSVMDVGNLLAIADSWISPNGFHWRRVQKGSLPGRNCSRFLHTCGPLFRVF